MKAQERRHPVNRMVSLLFPGLGLVLASPCASAMEAPANEPPEEIIVTGEQSLTQLQLRIELAQDRMFGLFNELNDDDQYDIACHEDQRTGTRISQRVCLPEFLRKAMELNARAFLAGVQGTRTDDGGVIGGSAVHSPAPQAVIEFRYPILREKMQALVEQSPEFAEVVQQHYELNEEFDRRTSSSAAE